MVAKQIKADKTVVIHPFGESIQITPTIEAHGVSKVVISDSAKEVVFDDPGSVIYVMDKGQTVDCYRIA